MDLPTPQRNPVFSVKVKPGARKDEVVSWDGRVLVVAVAAPADKNKANVELVKFLTKTLGHPVRIKTGLASKEKIVVFV